MACACTLSLLFLTQITPGMAQLTKAGVLRFEGKLTAQDPRDPQRQGPMHMHFVKFKQGKVYTIDMVSSQLDSYLRLEDAKGAQLEEDDDSGGGLNARIVFNCSRAGIYKVICTSFNAGAAGAYTLTIKEGQQVAQTGTPHQALVGKPAADFRAGIVINGKTTRLADLKGKVVLLTFWEVQSGPSNVVLPRLRDWQKAYQKDGLAIVGLTFYNFEIGQNLAFDRASGQFQRLSEANATTEEAMLRAFAAHHRLEFLVLALPRAAAVKTFDAYAVNGLPQFVLIDREGIVRAVRVGEDEQTAAYLETEFKKLLKEK